MVVEDTGTLRLQGLSKIFGGQPMGTARTEFPLFSLLAIRPGKLRAYFWDVGDDCVLPLFTSNENAFLFLKRARLQCLIAQFIYPADLLALLVIPPGYEPEKQFSIAMDLISPNDTEYMRFDRQVFVHRLQDLTMP